MMNRNCVRFCVSLASLLICIGIFLMACGQKLDGNPQSAGRGEGSAATQPTPYDGVRRVTITELRNLLEKGEALVVDVRGEVDYKLGHIKDARLVPLGLVAQQSADLPRDKLIVTYCA